MVEEKHVSTRASELQLTVKEAMKANLAAQRKSSTECHKIANGVARPTEKTVTAQQEIHRGFRRTLCKVLLGILEYVCTLAVGSGCFAGAMFCACPGSSDADA